MCTNWVLVDELCKSAYKKRETQDKNDATIYCLLLNSLKNSSSCSSSLAGFGVEVVRDGTVGWCLCWGDSIQFSALPPSTQGCLSPQSPCPPHGNLLGHGIQLRLKLLGPCLGLFPPPCGLFPGLLELFLELLNSLLCQ